MTDSIPKTRYVFKKRWKRFLTAFFDGLGWLIRNILGPFRSKGMKPASRILIIRLDSLGDAVLTLPAIEILEKRFPKAKIDFLVSPQILEFYTFCFPRSSIHVLENHWLDPSLKLLQVLKGFFKTTRWIQRVRYDLAVDFRGDLRTILLMCAGRIPERWGKTGTGGGFLLTRFIHPVPEKHELLENCELVKGGETLSPVGFRELPLPEQNAEWLHQMLIPAKGKRLIVIHPGAGYPSKQWPPERFLELAGRIHETGLGFPILVGGSREAGAFFSKNGAKPKEKLLNLMGRTSLTDLMQVMHRSDLFIGNDSGPAHLAAMLKLKMVVIFSGTNDFRKWAPWSKTLRMITYPVPCSPCGERICPLEKHLCMENISVDQVLDASKEILHSS